MDKIDFKNRSIRITLITLLVYALLVATHEGEFWPFSIYPMFSQAGNPWTRALVQDVADVPEQLRWEITTLDNLHGKPIPVGMYGVDQIDFSNYVSKTFNWTEERKTALITMFGSDRLEGEQWMITRVEGELAGGDSVVVRAIPFLMLTSDSVATNPHLPGHYYFRD